MTPEERQKFDEQLSDMLIAELESEKWRWPSESEQRAIVSSLLAKRREHEHAAADASTQKRWEQTFQQTERHHKASRRWALIGAATSIIGAAASWTGVWFSHSQAQRVQQPAATPAPTAVATPAPAVSSD